MDRLFSWDSTAAAGNAVISECMLQEAVKEEGEALKYSEVTRLRLEFKNIFKIEHLWEFTSLVKLQMTNNCIEKIEGLEILTNLECLDLSYNKIKVIEGLDTLVKLKQLNLSMNNISVIENMDTLEHLQHLSLAHTRISQLDNTVEYLRRFKNLRSLRLAGNPISRKTNYTLYIVAHLPDLLYLDFMIVDKQTRERALDEITVTGSLGELEEDTEIKAQTIAKQELQLHRDAFVEDLNGPHPFGSMTVDDGDEVPETMESYELKMSELCMQLFNEGLTQHAQRNNEVDSFFTCYREAVSDNQQKSNQIVTDFEEFRRQAEAEMQELTDSELVKIQRDIVRDNMYQVKRKLMMLEMQLSDNLEDISNEFERKISDLVEGFIEYAQEIFDQCRKLAMHGEKNNHLLKIEERKNELINRINSWKTALIEKIEDEQLKRKYKFISEIGHYI
ncbi:dynein regulatory complex subunit 3 [Astyanax mexicanus]|uniref:dynein regulatory complex subunit 3 n=1 Tax=Astyanax mexicanus TaxID=7994 RepID=UPI0020CB5CB9|nr:dynein regulatory complex subunit 3 [Astyanax mexicanus]